MTRSALSCLIIPLWRNTNRKYEAESAKAEELHDKFLEQEKIAKCVWKKWKKLFDARKNAA